jgi:assimilatory nitrate reductase catalytic subunit
MDGHGPLTVKTTCPYCGTGCGVDAQLSGGQVTIRGDAQHPGNAGRLCVKGAALGETLHHAGRLLYPQLRADRQAPFQRGSWDQALDRVAGTFRRLIDTHGPGAVAWYVSGQLLTEDYYVANKLVKGFVGSANIDTNSRLCMSSAAAGHKRAFGEDIVPVSYADLERADLVVLVGSNTAWCHPILFQRLLKARERRPELRLVVVDPRRTATSDMADLHLPLRGGSDVWLFNGLLHHLHQHGALDTAFVAQHTRGAEDALRVAAQSSGDPAEVARRCGLMPDQLADFYALFTRSSRVVTAFSMGVNQSSAGTDKVNSIINCHLLTGRIGKPGAGPFSLTGQPNAMGGREVGGLSNMLAAHLDLEQPTHRELVQGFWNSPRIADSPGLRAVELFDAIDNGEVKAVWIMATNPVVSLPDADRVRRALARCKLVVVSDVMAQTDTTAQAHVLLPALGWGEKDGTVTNSERCISRQRAFLPAPGEARPDWWALSEIARRWGYAAQFAYRHPAEIFDEHARLSQYRNHAAGGVPRYFNLSGLAGLDAAQYDRLAPQRWPVLSPDNPESRQPVFADGRFYHPDGRARLVPVIPREPVSAPTTDWPLVLNTGRVRDHWHTMTRTGLSPRLATHCVEPYVDLHPEDAARCQVRERELARVSSRWGSCVVRVRLSGEMQPGSVFVPIHWNGQFASSARVGSLVNPVVDPLSGEPEFKHTPVRVEPCVVAWYGFLLLRQDTAKDPAGLQERLAALAWWTRVTGEHYTRFELAGTQPAAGAMALLLQDLQGTDIEWLDYQDAAAGIHRRIALRDGRLQAALFLSAGPDLPARNWLGGLFSASGLDTATRAALLGGEPPAQGEETGPLVCACFGVGRNTLLQAIRTRGLRTPAALGQALRCGTNCGSCIPELKRLIDHAGSKV